MSTQIPNGSTSRDEMLTPEELDERAEELARASGLDGAEEAFRLLDAGDLEGTVLESELKMIRFLKSDTTTA